MKIAILVMLMVVLLLNLDTMLEFALIQDEIFLLSANHLAQHVLEKVNGTAYLVEPLLDILKTQISLVKLSGAGHARITADHVLGKTFVEVVIQDTIFGLMDQFKDALNFVQHAEQIHQAKSQLHFVFLVELVME